MSKNENNRQNDNTNKQSGKFEMPNFELPKMEVPAAFRELAEKTIQQSKENYDRLKLTAEQTTDILENAFSAYSKGSLELTSKKFSTMPSRRPMQCSISPNR